AQADVGLAVAVVVRAPFGRGQLDLGHVAQAHHVAIGALAQRHRREVLRFDVAALHAQREVATARLDATGRQLDVLGAERGLDVVGGDATRGHRRAVQPHAHGITLAAADAYL